MKKMMGTIIQFMIFSLFILGPVQDGYSEMYKWVDENGVVHFSDVLPKTEAPSKIKTLPTVSTNPNTIPYKNKFPTLKEEDLPDTAAHIKDEEKRVAKVELYTTSWCPYCIKAKAFFKDRQIPFVEYDIEKDPEAAIRKKKLDKRGNGVPFAMINGKGVHGFNKNAYIMALGE